MSERVSLKDHDLSAIYRSADGLSGRGQRRTKRLVRIELVSLILAGAAGVTSIRIGPDRLDVLAALSALFFVTALGSTVLRSLQNPEDSWYAGRAAAESARTLGWRYAMRAFPFPDSDPDPVNGERFLRRINEVLAQVRETALAPTPLTAHELTPGMVAMRAQELPVRRASYKHDRIEDQLAWYLRRSRSHKRKADFWLAVTSLASVLGVVAALFKVVGEIDVDLLGVAGACASAAIAWNQLNQHRTQVSAYTVTARELSIIRDRVDLVADADWARFVSDAEDAISREHTLWLARHGHPGFTGE